MKDSNPLLQQEVQELEEQLKLKKTMLKNQAGISSRNLYFIPLSIIIAGALIGVGLFYGIRSLSQDKIVGNVTNENAQPEPTGSIESVKPVSNQDHIRGNPEAPVKIIEFSDTECPFCKRFHPTMQQALKEYDGKIVWVYRHFPLDAIHSRARKESEATECANELGGNTKFWAYLDRLFEITPSNNNLDPAELPKIAAYVGLDSAKFTECLDSGKYAQHVADDLADATNSGGQGTPWSIVISPNGKKFPLSGAQPYAAVKTIIEEALRGKQK